MQYIELTLGDIDDLAD